MLRCVCVALVFPLFRDRVSLSVCVRLCVGLAMTEVSSAIGHRFGVTAPTGGGCPAAGGQTPARVRLATMYSKHMSHFLIMRVCVLVP